MSPYLQRYVYYIALLILTILVVTTYSQSHVNAQESIVYTVETMDSSARYDALENVVSVSGSVKNNLEVDIVDAYIVGLLVYDGDMYSIGSTNISKIHSGETTSFAFEINADSKPSSYSVHVVQYQLDTQDVGLLFDYFWDYEADYILRQSIVSFFESPSDVVISQIIVKFETNITQGKDVHITLEEDLLMLPVLSQSRSIDALKAIVDRRSTYFDERYQDAFLEMTLAIDDNNESPFSLLNDAYHQNKSLVDVWYDLLFSIDESEFPELFENENRVIREKLGNLYLERGKNMRSVGERKKAVEYLKKAQLYLDNPKEAEVEFGKAFTRENWLLILIGIVILVGTSYTIKGTQER